MGEAKILELARAVDLYALLDTYADYKGYELGGGRDHGEAEKCLADIEAGLVAFARLVAAAEREACANAAISSIQDCHREQGAANNGRSSDMAFGYVSGAEAAAEAIRGK